MSKVVYCERLGATPEDWFPVKNGEKVTFGRSISNQIRLFSEFISREHAIIEEANGGIFITDLKSLNGIHVNGIKIKSNLKHGLKVGDKVEIGKPLDIDEWKHLKMCDRFIYEVKEDVGSSFLERPTVARVHKSLFSIKQHEERSKLSGKKRKLESAEIETTQPEKETNLRPTEKEDIKINESSNTTSPKSSPKKRKGVHFDDSDSSVTENHEALIPSEGKELAKIEKHQPEEVRTEIEEQLRQQLLQEKELAVQREKEVALAAQRQAQEQTKKDVVVKLEEELQCIICSELFVKSITLNCGHTFCKYCIDGWLKKKNKVCPLCRSEVTSRNHSLVLDNYISAAIAEMSPELQERRKALILERTSAEMAARSTPKPARKRKRKRWR